MKKTFTKEEFKALTHKVIANTVTEAEDKNLSKDALMAFTMTYIVAFGELTKELFDDDTNMLEITSEKEI